jgi:hypothetical protein
MAADQKGVRTVKAGDVKPLGNQECGTSAAYGERVMQFAGRRSFRALAVGGFKAYHAGYMGAKLLWAFSGSTGFVLPIILNVRLPVYHCHGRTALIGFSVLAAKAGPGFRRFVLDQVAGRLDYERPGQPLLRSENGELVLVALCAVF